MIIKLLKCIGSFFDSIEVVYFFLCLSCQFSFAGNIQNTNISNLNKVLTLTYSCLIYAKIRQFGCSENVKNTLLHISQTRAFILTVSASFNFFKFFFRSLSSVARHGLRAPLFPQGDCMSGVTTVT